MKRKVALLALPLVLAGLMLVVKWRAEHPEVTEEDRNMRALISHKTFKYMAIHMLTPPQGEMGGPMRNLSWVPSPQELKQLTDSLYLSPLKNTGSPWNGTGNPREVFLQMQSDKLGIIWVSLNPDNQQGNLAFSRAYLVSHDRKCNLHPVTVKRGLEILMSNPQIGPQLRAWMKSFSSSRGITGPVFLT